MNVGHLLVGFRKTDELIGQEHEISVELLAFAKRLAKVRKDDPDAVFPYPLRPAEAQKLAAAMGAPIDPERYNYFLEGYAKTEASTDTVPQVKLPESAAP